LYSILKTNSQESIGWNHLPKVELKYTLYGKDETGSNPVLTANLKTKTMSINIDWSSREDENITCTFRGEYNGIGFTINANWNSWDDWDIDSIEYDQEVENSEEVAKEISDLFYENMD
jgi:hypothetical protein